MALAGLGDERFVETARRWVRPRRSGPRTASPATPGDITGIYELGGDELPVSAPFGSVEVENLGLSGCHQIPSGLVPRSAWVTPLLSAEGGDSVGLRAVAVD